MIASPTSMASGRRGPRGPLWGQPAMRRILASIVVGGPSCWTWPGETDRKGYGRVASGRRGSKVSVHRTVYEALVGPISDGMVIDHLCRNRRCVRPDHMEVVTNRENLLRGLLARGKRRVAS